MALKSRFQKNITVVYTFRSRDSIGSIVTRYGLNGPGIESRWGVVRISASVQTGSEAHPASYTVGTGSSPGIKRPRCGVDHPPPPSSAEVRERVDLYLYSPSQPSWPVLGWTFYTFNSHVRHGYHLVSVPLWMTQILSLKLLCYFWNVIVLPSHFPTLQEFFKINRRGPRMWAPPPLNRLEVRNWHLEQKCEKQN